MSKESKIELKKPRTVPLADAEYTEARDAAERAGKRFGAWGRDVMLKAARRTLAKNGGK